MSSLHHLHVSSKHALPVALLAAGLVSVSTSLAAQQSTGEAWQIITPPQATLVYASNGALIGELGKELRTNISIRTLPPYVGHAFIAVEDQRFYQHNGVDLIGIAGALKDNIMGAHRGASTITQQLVGNMHPDIINRNDMSLDRKLREQAAAREMERHYNKEQILEAYLNQISFGHRYFGIESAARHYFAKSATQLTLTEAATLAAMPKGPSYYDPVVHPDRALERRNVVLTLMAQQHYITNAQAAEAKATPLVTVPDGGMAAPAQYVVDVVRSQALRAGIPVDAGGYRIYTSIDPMLQRVATDALQEEAAAVEKEPNYHHPRYPDPSNNYLQGAVVVMDPTTGDVRALVGGRDYARSPFDRAVDGMRQPGSSFKPVVYATAVADSMTPTTLVGDTAIAVSLPNGTYYRPSDDDHRYLGTITLREALAKSRNIVAVELWQRFGADSIISTARRMGIVTPIAPVPASAIGASVVQPINLISAYTAFANLGTPVQSRFIYRVEDASGKILMAPPIRALPPALDPRTTFVVRDMMRDVVQRGTATTIRRYVSSEIPVAGKTGTTSDNTDAWFIGMTPDLVAGVWLGFDKPQSISKDAFGGAIAAPIWGKIIAKYYAIHGPPHTDWTPPLGVISAEMDRTTGQLATATTPLSQRYTEYFVEGTEPAALKLNPAAVVQRGIIF